MIGELASLRFMVSPTKTLGPLHLEDLEPHRFEDLVRQLLYDFRPWRDLEATGRAGGDGGFDARAWEMPETTTLEGDGDDSVKDLAEEIATPSRQWIIQCKREKTISPAKLRAYLEALPTAEETQLHGLFFVAAADFSRAARDVFYETVRRRGFMEFKLWGRAEIEDQLFQPKNDHLLFAYFGISLQVRQRTLKTAVRAKLATKTKAAKVLQHYVSVVVRDASDDRYPFADPDLTKPWFERRRWKVFRCLGCFHDGVHFEFKRHFAFIADDREHWDVADWRNEASISFYEDPWCEEEETDVQDDPLRTEWLALPPANQAWMARSLVLPYESIIAIDDEGDELSRNKHVYVVSFDRTQPFRRRLSVTLENNETFSKLSLSPDPATRIEHFARPATNKFPDVNAG